MKYDGTNFDKVVEMHEHWLECGMKVNKAAEERADFSNTELTNIVCKNHNLSHANFYCAKIDHSSFDGCIFCHALFIKAILINVRFYMCDIQNAGFNYAKLYNTRFRISDLTFATFTNASFDECNFYTSYIGGIQDLATAKNVPNVPMACPDTGSFIGWKKVFLSLDLEPSEPGCIQKMVETHGIAKLLIPEDARRSSATGRKCRCNKAKVLEIQDMNGNILNNAIARSFHDNDFIYITGKMITPTLPFEENRWEECASGIHFFITREEAVNYGG